MLPVVAAANYRVREKVVTWLVGSSWDNGIVEDEEEGLGLLGSCWHGVKPLVPREMEGGWRVQVLGHGISANFCASVIIFLVQILCLRVCPCLPLHLQHYFMQLPLVTMFPPIIYRRRR